MAIKRRFSRVESCATCVHSRFTKSETGKVIMICNYDFERVTFLDICPNYKRFKVKRNPQEY